MRIVLTIGTLLLSQFSCASTWSDLSFDADTFSTTTYVQPLLIDPSGMRTGLLGPNGPQVNDIPNSNYTVDAAEDIDAGVPGVEGVEVGVAPVLPGQYTLILWGIAEAPYEGTMRISHTDGSVSLATFQGFVVENSSQQYTVSVDPAPGAQFSIVKTIDFKILQQELRIAFEIGQIGDQQFVDGLANLLIRGAEDIGGEGKDDRDRRSNGKRESIETLREFIAQIENAKEKSSDRDHDDKRFVTSAAAQTLTTDAKTLIAQLEPAPGRDHDERHEKAR